MLSGLGDNMTNAGRMGHADLQQVRAAAASPAAWLDTSVESWIKTPVAAISSLTLCVWDPDQAGWTQLQFCWKPLSALSTVYSCMIDYVKLLVRFGEFSPTTGWLPAAESKPGNKGRKEAPNELKRLKQKLERLSGMW